MERPAKKVKHQRSKIACKRCHGRRVKCDVSTRGIPCSGCVAGRVAECCQPVDSRKVRGEKGRFSARAPDSASTAVAAPSSPLSTAAAPMPTTQASASPVLFPAERSSKQPQSVRESLPKTTENEQSPASEADQWSKIISNDHPRASESSSIVYLGESWTLSFMTRWRSRGSVASPGTDTEYGPSPPTTEDQHSSLHVAVPVDTEETPLSSMIRPTNTAREQQQLPIDIQMALIDAYFAHNYVLYPIILQQEFRQSFVNRSMSELLLSAVLYGGALHATDSVIYRAGFENREVCLLKLYEAAKKLFFDDEHKGEVRDQLPRVQAAFIFQNMWPSPNAMMDPWSWLGLAIRLAQNMGMHRSTAHSSLRAEDQKVWKRIWWALYTRDRQSASALGKPLMINEKDCDVELLTPDDFEPTDSKVMRLFVIEQVKLASFTGQIIDSRFTPGSQEAMRDGGDDRATLMKSLMEWREDVPNCLQRISYEDAAQVPIEGLWLEVLFNNLLLLLHRPRITSSDTAGFENDKESWKIAFDAARSITLVTETIMNYKSLYSCPLFYTSALFGAMTMHAIRGGPAAEHQLSVCMIAMRTLSKMYWAAGWIRNIFQKFGGKKQKTVQDMIYTSALPTRASSPTAPANDPIPSRINESKPHQHPSLHGTTVWRESQSEFAEVSNLGCQCTTQLQLPQANTEVNGIQYVPFTATNQDHAGSHIFDHNTDVRNMMGYMDYPSIDHSGLASIDPDFADWWQDLLTTDVPFSNPFITGDMR